MGYVNAGASYSITMYIFEEEDRSVARPHGKAALKTGCAKTSRVRGGQIGVFEPFEPYFAVLKHTFFLSGQVSVVFRPTSSQVFTVPGRRV